MNDSVQEQRASARRFGFGPTVWELCALAIAVGVTSLLVVRCNWITIWMDTEFTGWVAPVANRLASGVRLYQDQAHSPMPPLPYVVTYVVSGGEAVWLTESVLIVVAQSLLVLVMYVGMTWYFPRPVPLVAAFTSIPLFFALPKTIFYDALVQLCVALLAAVTVPIVASSRWSEEQTAGRRSRTSRFGQIALGAALAAITILSKQSTGIGATFGTMLMLTFLGTRTLRGRLIDAGWFALSTAAALVALSLIISPWVSIDGMLRDVFLTGSEPKGGARVMVSHLVSYASTLVGQIALFVAYGLAFAALGRAGRHSEDPARPSSPSERPDRWAELVVPISAATIAAPILVGCLAVSGKGLDHGAVLPKLAAVRETLLSVGLAFALLASLRAVYRRSLEHPWDRAGAFPAMFSILFAAAIFHSLSVSELRWTYDNNPLITLVLAGLVYGALHLGFPAGGVTASRTRWATAGGWLFVSYAFWTALAPQIQHFNSCRDAWPEVRHLRGARMPKDDRGMRQFIAAVRDRAPDPESDAVLFLPNDPNIEAWLERPRPRLSSSIIFTDQYWDRYVDADLQRLHAAPPRVIVIGPRNYWRIFQRCWNVNKGCERLIDLVQARLLPGRYRLSASQSILYRGKRDYMDIYVLDQEPALGAAVARKSDSGPTQ